MTTDLQGSVNYLGVNLKSLGLANIGSLVTPTSNSVPSLQLKAQGKSTQTSQVDFVIPQTILSQVKSSKYAQAFQKNGAPYLDENYKPLFKPVSNTVELPDDLNLTHCLHRNPVDVAEYLWFRLWLDDALGRYKKRLQEDAYQLPGLTFAERVCQPKLTVATQFQLLFDVQAGTNILQNLPILLPVSGLNVDASPDYTHSVQIIFALRQKPDYNAACTALQTQNPPASAQR